MSELYNFIISNIYLYICIIIVLLIFTTMLFILVSNQKKRKKIQDDFVEAERVEMELDKMESEKTSELDELIMKMQQDMEMTPEDVVKKFEEEQEEKAIISYQELVDNVKAGKIEVIDDDNSDVNFVSNLIGEEQIEENFEPILEVSETEEVVTPDMVKDAIESISRDSIKVEQKKFKQSEVISPVYGRVSDINIEYPTIKKTTNTLDIMNTKDYSKLTEEINAEIKRQEEFLNALIQFKNNL